MDIWTRIAERKIEEAMRNGEFQHFEGAGKPLVFEDEAFVPEDLRMAYRVLKNAGCLPPEIELRKEINTLRDLIDTLDDDEERLRKIREFNFKLMKLEMMRKRPLQVGGLSDYEARIVERVVG